MARRRRGRRAVTGIFLATLLFASLFLAGLGYYIYQSQASLTADQGAQSRQQVVQGSNSEDLVITVHQVQTGVDKDWLAIDIYNAGGVTTTVMAVFVTNTADALVSSSQEGPTHSQFLTAPPDINLSLPLSLVPGEGTVSMAGCAGGQTIGCNIMINASSCQYCETGGPLLVSVITGRGNTFSGQFPAPATSATVVNSYVSTTSVVSVTTDIVSTTAASTVATSQTAAAGFQAGTNSLLLVMDACAGSTTTPFGTTCSSASTVYTNQEVILTISVTNYADVAMGTYVDFQEVGTNGASVSGYNPDDCASGSSYQTSTVTIPADTGTPSTQTYTCTFIASQGPSGGTVTFIGYAVGTYAAVPPAQVTSAEGLSNPIELGNPESTVTGPFVPVSFDYASEESTTFTPATIVPATTSEYVIWQATLENTANASLTILQYSSVLNARIRQEEGYYIVSPVSTWTSTTLGAYACTNTGTGGGPTGASCTAPSGQTQSWYQNCPPPTTEDGCVPTGSTVTLDFAACAAGTGDWMWETDTTMGQYSACSNNDSGLNPPEAVTMFVIVVYEYYNAGTWHVLSQSVPMTGVYFTG